MDLLRFLYDIKYVNIIIIGSSTKLVDIIGDCLQPKNFISTKFSLT